MNRQVRILTHYIVAFFAVGFALLVRLLLSPMLEQSAEFFLFTFAIVLASWRGGLGPGLFATALSAFVINYFLMEPYQQLFFFSRRGIAIALFALSGVCISWLSERRLRSEAEQGAASRKISSILESITDSYYAVDRQWRFTDINDRAAAHFKKEREEVIGKIIWDVFPQAVGGDSYLQFHRAMETQAPAHFEVASALASGNWLDVHAYPSAEGLSVYFRDITKRKRAEEKLRESEELYRTLARNFPGGAVFLFDRDLRYRVAEGAGLADVGLAKEDIEGKSIWEALPPEICEVVEPVSRAVLAGRSVTGEYPYCDRVYFTQAIPVKNAEGRPIAGMFVCLDITDRKMVEDEREQLLVREQAARAEAEAATRAKDEFLAMVSHELRSPLSAIKGWADIMLRRQNDAKTVAHAAEVIKRSAAAQSQLIEDLLDTARIISGKFKLNVGPVDLRSVINAAAELVRPAAEAKPVTLQLSLTSDPIHITGDSDRLQQVVWNLLSNSIKFTPEGGRVEISLEQEASSARITVRDTGKGISPEFLPHVFERFRQADGGESRRLGGLGLGLALVKDLVELHGGGVQVTSAGEGRGATFTVELPLQPPSAAGDGREKAYPASA
jgi:PAS domain S-box-containing protein